MFRRSRGIFIDILWHGFGSLFGKVYGFLGNPGFGLKKVLEIRSKAGIIKYI